MGSVLIFDSGVGGLSVFEEVAALLPQQHVIYVFDNEAFPYGELDDETLIIRVSEMISKIISCHDVSLVVIACNTASTLVLPVLRSQLSVPIVGVVPAIKPAASLTKTKQIALLATPATVRRQYTHALIQEFASDCEVQLLATTDLVWMAEKKLRGENVDIEKLSLLLKEIKEDVDYLILGCTHFPLLKKELKQGLLNKECQIIDSGKAIANRVQQLLSEQKSKNDEANKKRHFVYSSALVSHQEKLNDYFYLCGFSKINTFPIFSDR